ncbi:sugar kinase [Jeotgalibacillus proteolyticus]|uniref:Sugar kinase n=2 Tax=Jeotgalibacillus proteolyticus TaxID=2082395 RepID=A0A2S5GAM5_9BACL|nr:sugar kinase [Jeotgalibacillus proteolyticus]
MKSINKSIILNTIRVHSPISRSEIAKKTSLTPPTVTNIVAELIKSKIVREFDVGVSSGGRKPILLTINERDLFIVGIDVGDKSVRASLTNLNAKNLFKMEVSMPYPLTNQVLLETLHQIAEQIIILNKIERSKVLGIGIGMHGIVDYKNGVAIFAPNFNLKNIPIKSYIENHMEIPVYVENDARALALGETWFGKGQGIENLICINIGVGIGAGIIYNNELFRGEYNIAGEFGHMIIDLNGKLCSCGSYGCLQTVAGGGVLTEKVVNGLKLGRKTLIIEKLNGNMENITGELIHQCALQGDEYSIKILAETGRYIGVGVTNLINLINPARIIIGGGVSKSDEFILGPIREVVQQRALTEEARNTEIVKSELGEDGTVIGAVTLVLKDIFSTMVSAR